MSSAIYLACRKGRTLLMSKTTVLIVGAGPVGLSMAVELARRSIEFRILDKTDSPSNISKALAVHARTLELFEDMNVFDEFISKGHITHGFNIYNKNDRIVHVSFDELVCPHPYIVMLPQSETEAILARRLEQFGGRVERSHELIAIEQNADSVRATIKTPSGEEEIEAAWLVACDGSHSFVRKALNLKFQGSQYDEIFGAVDASLDTHLAHDEVNTFLAEDGVLALFPLPENRWRILYDLKQGDLRDKDDKPTLEEAQTVMNTRGIGAAISNPTWFAYFRINKRQIDSYRTDRVFLAGDAAHIHSPMGGVGMNTGIHDAVNLAWKLDLVIRGVASEKLLDSYHEERHPIAKDVLFGTDMAMKVATLRNPVSEVLRKRMLPVLLSQEVIQQRLTKTGSLIAVNYRGSKIVGEHRAGFFEAAAENPSISERFEFANGPKAGDRAPDGQVKLKFNGDSCRFFDLIRDTRHKLVMFDGFDCSSAGYQNLADIAAKAQQKYGNLMSVFTVSPQPAVPDELNSVCTYINDQEMELHRCYGANSECLYLIRPDGYIGFRSQPASFEKLDHYIQTQLLASPAKVR
jgi:2-polyprenyl-6-methoxyphenol hydroxylase-like FAD-dependent oxidoreductase